MNGASLLFKAGKAGDYHGEMNSSIFEEWMKNDFLPKLEEPCLIILDNASYHSRQADKVPTMSSRKEVMIQWLRGKHIPFSESATKDQLFQLIKPLTGTRSFVVDQIIEEAGHEVLRLPPYHCQFNAIEMVWSQTKRYYDNHIIKNKDVLKTWSEALNNVSEEQWTHYVRHTESVIQNAWDRFKITQSQQPLIINLDESDMSSDYETSE